MLCGYHAASWADAIGPLMHATKASRQPASLRTDKRSNNMIELIFESGIEGKILHIEQVNGKDYAFAHFINGPYIGKRGWIPVKPTKGRIRFYAVHNHQAFQTLIPTEAKFVRTIENTLGILNLDFKAEDLGAFEFVEKEYTVDFFDRYPRTRLTQVKAVDDAHWDTSCPERPIRKSGKQCQMPPKRYDIPSWLIADIRRSAKKHDVHPAIVAAIIQKESFFNPFSVNRYEKNLCEKQKRMGKECAAYKWGQGFAQTGATNSARFGLRWLERVRRPKACQRGRHVWRKSCYNHLVRACNAQVKKTGLASSYCPKQGIDAVARYVSELINSEHSMRVDVKLANGKWGERVVNVKDHMRRTLAEEFRYIVGMYNRGKRPINSVEEHFRQHGKAPEWYDVAWTTRRVDGITPSSDMGYMILYKESINRCHVWQVAGLCGLALGDSLAGQYLELFPDWPARNQRTVASDL